MQFRNGILSFVIIIALSLALIIIGIILFAKSKNTISGIKISSILMIVIGIIVMLLSKKVCFGYVKIKENISVTQMMQAKTPSYVKSVKEVMKTIDSLKFNDYGKSYENASESDRIMEILTGNDSKGANLEVKVMVFGNEQEAYNSFDSECNHYGNKYGVLDSGGTEYNRYFVTYKNQIRSSAESFYQLIDTYVTYVFFQKGNMIIRLWETKDSGDSSKINNYINLLSNKLATLK